MGVQELINQARIEYLRAAEKELVLRNEIDDAQRKTEAAKHRLTALLEAGNASKSEN